MEPMEGSILLPRLGITTCSRTGVSGDAVVVAALVVPAATAERVALALGQDWILPGGEQR